jgi:O-antigen ligase
VISSTAYQLAGITSPFSDMFRAMGTMNDANLFSAYLGAGFFLTLLCRQLCKPAPYWTIAAMAMQLAGITFSASRGGLLAFATTLLLGWLIVTSPKIKIRSLGAATLLLIAATTVPKLREFVLTNPVTARLTTTTVSLNDPEAQQRAGLWKMAVDGLLHFPLLGVGRGNFGYLAASEGNTRAHNTYLEMLCESGFVGAAAGALFVCATLLGPARDWWHHPISTRRTVTAMLGMAFMVVCLAGVTISIENFRGLWILMAVLERFHTLYLVPSA